MTPGAHEEGSAELPELETRIAVDLVTGALLTRTEVVLCASTDNPGKGRHFGSSRA